MEEIWLPITGYEDSYEVSNFGRVKSLARSYVSKGGSTAWKKERFLRGDRCKRGFVFYRLYSDAVRKKYGAARLVLEMFYGAPPNPGAIAVHKDGDASNNWIGNLFWGDERDAITGALDRGTARRGEQSSRAVLSAAQVEEIRRLHSAGMRICDLARLFPICWEGIYVIVKNKKWKRDAVPRTETLCGELDAGQELI